MQIKLQFAPKCLLAVLQEMGSVTVLLQGNSNSQECCRYYIVQVDYAGKLCKVFASIKLLLAHELFAL